MTVLYLDANALAKLYVTEHDSDEVVRAVDAVPSVASCAIAYAEVCGVFARYLRDGALTEAAHDDLARAFAEDWGTVSVIEVSPRVSQLAGQLLKAHRGARLRALDALHLASALEARTVAPLRFLTFDADLARVARALMPDASI